PGQTPVHTPSKADLCSPPLPHRPSPHCTCAYQLYWIPAPCHWQFRQLPPIPAVPAAHPTPQTYFSQCLGAYMDPWGCPVPLALCARH
ncbi:hypothetical protein XENTR_v10015749, partial [Xenopus tropicalis]